MWGFFAALISGALMSIQGVFNTEVTRQSSLWVSTGWVQLSAFAVCVLAWLFTGRQSIAHVSIRLEEIYQLSRKENLGVLFITHDLGVVAEIADDVSIMKDGEIVENGTVEDIFYHPQHSYTKKLLDAVL